ncbi:MAG: glycosyltransferase [Chloroflexota bacterium]|nr:glycosyltransferase [Chloroflexota bacterium]
MPVRSLAILSLHTSPLAQAGSGDGGGMNVYVRSLASGLARAGVACDVYTRAEHPAQPRAVVLEPRLRVIHIEAGPQAPVEKERLPGLVDEFTAAMLDGIRECGRDYDAVHANYWLSGQVAHRLKHELDLPMVATFHTLARVKAAAGELVLDDPLGSRAQSEAEIMRCADLILASTGEEADQLVRLYGAEEERIEILPPGVDHAVFSSGPRPAARAALGHPGERVLLFVGRIQPLKGLDLAVRTLAEIDDATLWVVGGPSGTDGPSEMDKVKRLADTLGVAERVLFLPPQPHHHLAGYYRAADVCLVPSRSESFGLVALEAAACGTPVVASAVGGIPEVVVDGETGLLVPVELSLDDPMSPVDPDRFERNLAGAINALMADAATREVMGRAARKRAAERFSWDRIAAETVDLYRSLLVP